MEIEYFPKKNKMNIVTLISYRMPFSYVKTQL